METGEDSLVSKVLLLRDGYMTANNCMPSSAFRDTDCSSVKS